MRVEMLLCLYSHDRLLSLNTDLFSEHLDAVRVDIAAGFSCWQTILQEQSKIVYAYSKGSATKPIETFMDYAPFISDIDIHVAGEGEIFSHSIEAFNETLDVGRRFEECFKQANPEALHQPRSQLMFIHRMKRDPDYIPPLKKNLTVLKGDPVLEFEYPESTVVRQGDRRKLLAEEEFLTNFHYTMIDRHGMEYWSGLRRMVYRVSPMCYRLVSQTHPDPLSLWGMNRTSLFYLLVDSYPDIAANLHSYYQSAWLLFLSNFQDTSLYRKVLADGFTVIYNCIKRARSL